MPVQVARGWWIARDEAEGHVLRMSTDRGESMDVFVIDVHGSIRGGWILNEPGARLPDVSRAEIKEMLAALVDAHYS